MKLDITRVDIWVAPLADRIGGLAKKLGGLAEAGVNLEFVIARRDAKGKKKTAVIFAAPIRGAQQTAAAKKLKFQKSKSISALRVTATDKPGLGLALTQALADGGLNLRGFSGVVAGKKAVMHIALDSAADASKALRILKQL